MRILIATPAYGGVVHTHYLHGLIESIYGAKREGMELGVYTLQHESLVNRARNTCAAIALEHRFDKLMFIDSDLGWKWPDLQKLIQSDKLVVGGTYPKKKFPISLNYNVLSPRSSGFNNRRKSIADHEELKKRADPVTGELEVLHIPTGFMMIDISVFRKLMDKVPAYASEGDVPDLPATIREFFPVRVRNGIMESEDWAFCAICRENGIPVYLNTRVICNHTGPYTFDVPRG
ncbi:MAG TPA: hypothetical protein VFH95_03430 [Candidatus Kapabacteria bacterium]|nr:hypothetical protein [Candidatus Kapabacteria bacterium]